MQYSLIERFSKGTKKKIPEDSDRNKPLKSLVIKYILNDIEHKWAGSETDQDRKRDLVMTASYIYVAYGYSLRGYEWFWVESQQLTDGINFGKHDSREPHVLVEVMGRFKG